MCGKPITGSLDCENRQVASRGTEACGRTVVVLKQMSNFQFDSYTEVH